MNQSKTLLVAALFLIILGSTTSLLAQGRQRGTAGAQLTLTPRAVDAGSRNRSTLEQRLTLTPRPTIAFERSSSPEAEQVISTFAADQLGIVVSPTFADQAQGETETSSTLMEQMPENVQNYLDTIAAAYDGTVFYGFWDAGFGAVGLGDCVAAECTIQRDSLLIQINTGSAGTYGLLLNSPAPTDVASALTLITSTYPGLASVTMSEYAVQQGYGFVGMTTTSGDPVRGQPIEATVKVVYAGVMTLNNQTLVYVTVGIGNGYVEALLG